VLDRLGDVARFDIVLAAEDVPHSKPDPTGYLNAMTALGLAPSDCLIIEDSVNGIAAARAAGCVVVAARAGNFGGWDQSGAHRVLDTLEELTPGLVDELFAIYGVPSG
jgi:beta-phosphoglucomutase-like phosphatase (HAD superfamily)